MKPLSFLAVFVASSGSLLHAADPIAAKIEFFEKKIRPLLADHCYTCHSADTKPDGGLRVDDLKGLLNGGKSGPAVVAGDPAKSLLLQRVSHADPKKQMPKDSDALTAAQVADLTTWIKDGAEWPRERIPPSLGRSIPEFEKLKRTHWAWQPLTQPKVPEIQQAAWAEDEVDRFILARLEDKKLSPVPDADRITLIRRITFDLTGLPPSPSETQNFLSDQSAHAFAKVVDRLLESPAFGEHWGRHWLDVARYGESTGPSRNIPYPHAWKYRDYVIDALNSDVPFDRFIQEQVAGDLLPAGSDAERDRLHTATGFLALGVKDVNQRFKERFIMDNVDEQIDAVTRSLLALTVNCARCHDHKFDPVSTSEYYALAGIFTSTESSAGVRNKMGGGGLDYYDPATLIRLSTKLPPPPEEKVKDLEVRLAEAKKAWEEIRGTPEGLKLAADGKPTQRPFRLRYEALQGEWLSLTDPAARGAVVHGVHDASHVADTEVRIRGEAERLGPTVERGFLSTVQVPGAPPINRSQSGRLELAQWLSSPQNPLTARVAVNRIWQHLFGEGIVSTVDNFGVNGARPSHPELLDHLAQRFIAGGWSVKKLARSIALSHAYRLGTQAPATHLEQDPANRLVWRHSPRHLSAEELRDAMLLSAGQLSVRPATSPASTLRMVEMRDNGPEAAGIHTAADQDRHRSIYLPLLRGVTPHALEVFDPVDQTLVTGRRATTTVPTQALYLLNSGFVRQQSLSMARHLLSLQPDQRISQAWWLTLGREPTPKEYARSARFIADYASTYVPEAAPAALVASTASASKAERPASATGNADDIDRTDALAPDRTVQPGDARTAAWLAFAQALYASAEFRFIR
ncbi:PSD1 and planctomycete cytochrome C domain-containing protein [Prosthecobacter vanneervenii]|uniref:Cytochrome c domain-containing protein n=1 Tax=Prosthecobacter vanneervenii TaxID=48466 RepID=A0A7W7YDD8_9BACT|nr:PSD1 and planctomycete cytochrome C domain-containing protein [Prosthecobacter vanneervenii]MBB5033780.1 hypothetical protein [Prosthecobacter vanneervenii]